MTQEITMEIFRNYFSYINRPGAADLLQWIESNGFFEAPASKRHHGEIGRASCRERVLAGV